MSERPDVVLVHGAWAGGSCGSAVIEALQADGFHVTAPQFPETSPADDGARLRHALRRQSGPTVVVGHRTSPSTSRPASTRPGRASRTPSSSRSRGRRSTAAAEAAGRAGASDTAVAV